MVSRGRLVDAACGASMCKIAGLKEEKVTEGGAVQSKWKKEKKSSKTRSLLGHSPCCFRQGGAPADMNMQLDLQTRVKSWRSATRHSKVTLIYVEASTLRATIPSLTTFPLLSTACCCGLCVSYCSNVLWQKATAVIKESVCHRPFLFAFIVEAAQGR